MAVSFPSHRQWLLLCQQLQCLTQKFSRGGYFSLSVSADDARPELKRKCLLRKKNKGTKEPYTLKQPCRLRPAARNYGQFRPSHVDREKRQLCCSVESTELPSLGIIAVPQLDKKPCSLEERAQGRPTMRPGKESDGERGNSSPGKN